MSAPAVPTSSTTTAPQAPKLLDQIRTTASTRYGRSEPGDRFASWARRFILFHDKRHPRDLGSADIGRFLQHLAQSEKDPLLSLELAREALPFLYQEVLHGRIGDLPYPEPPRLLDHLRRAIRLRHYSPRTERCYVEWVVRYIRFHDKRPPRTMGGPEIEMFLTDLAVRGHVAASTQNQAFNALLFLYQQVLGIELPRLDAVRARRPKRLPLNRAVRLESLTYGFPHKVRCQTIYLLTHTCGVVWQISS